VEREILLWIWVIVSLGTMAGVVLGFLEVCVEVLSVEMGWVLLAAWGYVTLVAKEFVLAAEVWFLSAVSAR